MKKTFTIIASVAALMLAANSTVLAEDKPKGKEVTITGEAKCGKCMLKEADAKECNTVIQVEKKGKTQNYYVVDNDISKAFHEDVCHSAKKVKASGTVAKVGSKQELTLTKIEIVKQ
jgi:hypothetical protein